MRAATKFELVIPKAPSNLGGVLFGDSFLRRAGHAEGRVAAETYWVDIDMTNPHRGVRVRTRLTVVSARP